MKKTHTKTSLSLAATLFCASAVQAEGAVSQSELPWYEQSLQAILETKIITATRNEKDLSKSPSTVSVYSAEDIKAMGVRNIKELLERIPGFFVNRQLGGPAIGSRGYIGDNEQFLLLIDGHNANSIVDKGPGFFFLFPMLEHIKRVEIVRGPGSTLWGSDAALGIIHLITKDGGDIDGKQVTHSQSNADEYKYTNFQVGKRYYEDVDVMFSLTSSSSEGFLETGNAFDPGTGRWEQIDDSFEMYAKARVKDFTLRMRASDFKNRNPIKSPGANLDQSGYHRRRHFYLDVENKTQYNPNFSLETRFFADIIQNFQNFVNPLVTPTTFFIREEFANRELATGIELTANWQINSSHHLMFGYRGVITEVDPVYRDLIQVPVNGFNSLSALVVPDKKDTNQAFFIENDWQVIEDVLGVVAGIRFDKNNLREENTIVLPRLAINYRLNKNNSLNFAYNTGYIRPPVGIGFLNQAQFDSDGIANYGAPNSEEVENLELKYSFQTNNFSTSINFYSNKIKDSFLFIYEPSPAGVPVADIDKYLFYINLPTIKSYGFEWQAQWLINRDLRLDASLSKVLKSRIDSLTGTAFGVDFDLNNTVNNFTENFVTNSGDKASYPHLMWNLGLTYQPNANTAFNLFYRGWDDMQARIALNSTTNIDAEIGAEHYVDFNWYQKNVVFDGLDFNVFVKNVFDNDDSDTHLVYFGQNWTALGRNIGAGFSYKF